MVFKTPLQTQSVPTDPQADFFLLPDKTGLARQTKVHLNELFRQGKLTEAEFSALCRQLDETAKRFRDAQVAAILLISERKRQLVSDYLALRITQEFNRERRLAALEKRLAKFS